MVVARAAAEHRRVALSDDDVFYGALTLRDTAAARAWGRLVDAIAAAWQAGVGEAEILDALQSGDGRLDASEAVGLLDWAHGHDQRLQDLNAHVLRDLLGEGG